MIWRSVFGYDSGIGIALDLSADATERSRQEQQKRDDDYWEKRKKEQEAQEAERKTNG